MPTWCQHAHAFSYIKAQSVLWLQENLYEDDVKDKARAANCIATLFRQAQHLEPLLSHATLLPTLARVLRDDGKRSVDLCIGIQSVWLVLSNFSQFHQLLIENQVGVLTMEVLDLEIKRTEHRVKVNNVIITCCTVAKLPRIAMCNTQHSIRSTQVCIHWKCSVNMKSWCDVLGTMCQVQCARIHNQEQQVLLC